MGSHAFLQGIFLTQGLNLGLLHCGQILYHLSQQGSNFTDEGTSSLRDQASEPRVQDLLAMELCTFRPQNKLRDLVLKIQIYNIQEKKVQVSEIERVGGRGVREEKILTG